ncbi:MAG: TlpA family protein disulfide reductase [Proteobacteria bacterium]|nr:TlpA family protein disulfide reductase [Pseudomonadota bacterium]
MRRRKLLTALGAAPLLRLQPALAKAPAAPIPKVGDVMRLPDAPLINGGTFLAAEAEGQVTLVYWWASWCPFCALQSPHMQRLWDAQRARGLKMLALSIDDGIEAPRQYMARKGYTFPSGHNDARIEKVLPKPGAAIPITCIRGRDGRVVFIETGQMFPEDVEALARFV